MLKFIYTAFTADGREARGVIDASNDIEARRLLKAKGFRVSVLKAAKGGETSTASSGLSLFRAKIDYERLFSDLAVLMNAGLGFDQSLQAMTADTSAKTNQQFAVTLLNRLSSGSSPSQALANAEGLRPDVVALVASGERSGRLGQVFSVLSAEMEKQNVQKRAFVEATVYPCFLLFIMFCALMVITFVLVPAIAPIFESSGREPPMIIAVLSVVRSILSAPETLIALVLAFAALAGLWLTKRPLINAALSRAILRLPIVGALIRKAGLARYLQSLALLLENGVPMGNALSLSAECCPVASYRKPLLSVCDTVISGKRLPDAFLAARIFPAGIVSLAAVGDEVNNLPAVLRKAAGIMQSEAQRALDRLLALMTPAITILLGFLVGGLVISVMTALLGINELSMQ
ncbi:type II secretion system F family protein [Phyllobacterium myrsinacearum]|uniref:General secretion pathway protein F n=1 Tax=Phyllobacterium myrsinacearum TaxID=28101 RepID=A0A839EXM3_9HYPH|nr:type II secretion system F family protein [Phyllobacterium myrsinacearum]MBA8882026.1 general secretion pathway protein F [Phyllobacterium myrsinacearum]